MWVSSNVRIFSMAYEFRKTSSFIVICTILPVSLLDIINKLFRKLENILCIDDKRFVISDFGFAKKIQSGQKLKEL
jgi:hypothetical protein